MFVGAHPAILRAGLLGGLRPQDVFATTLYAGTGAAQSITTGIDLTGGGSAWIKCRTTARPNQLASVARGAGLFTSSDSTNAEASTASAGLTAFNATGFSVGAGLNYNGSGDNFVAWSFKKAAKFYTEVVYQGDGTSGRQIAHDLGIAPGMIAVKRLDAVSNWQVWHAGLGNGYLTLNTTNTAAADNGSFWGNGSTYSAPTTSAFTVSNGSGVNASGGTYLARIWAHDPDTTNGIIQCGSFTEPSTGSLQVNLGWQPQALLAKPTSAAGDWYFFDTARGFSASSLKGLRLNASGAEIDFGSVSYFVPNSSGFSVGPNFQGANVVSAFVAIRSPV